MKTETQPQTPYADLESMINGIRKRDAAAIEVFVEQYEERLASLLRYKGYDFQTVEDAVQETYITVWEKIDQVQSAEVFPGWVTQIAINYGRILGNKMTQRKNVFERFTNLFPINILIPERYDAPLSNMINRERERLVFDAVSALPDEERSVLSLHIVEGTTYSDIAKMLGISESMVRTRLKNAKEALRANLEKVVLGGLVPAIGFTSPFPKVLDMIYSGKLTPPAPEFLVATTTTATAGSSKFASFMMYFAFPFLWLMSILVSGHVCAHKFITTAPTLPIRRWLVQQTFYCYFLMIVAPLVVSGLLSVFESSISHIFMVRFSTVFFGGLFVAILARFYWLNVTAKKFRENDVSPPVIELQLLRRKIYLSFTIGAALLVAVYGVDFFQRYPTLSSQSFLGELILPSFAFILFYMGAFFLFRYYLSLSENETVFQKTFVRRDWSSYSFWDELCFVSPFLVITLGPQTVNFFQNLCLPINGAIELMLYISIWCVVIMRNRMSPLARWKRNSLAFALMMVFMLVIRQTPFYG